MFFALRFRAIWQLAGILYALEAIKLVAPITHLQLLAHTLKLPLAQAPTFAHTS